MLVKGAFVLNSLPDCILNSAV